MRRIKVYDQLSVYAQRMLSLMNDPAFQGLEDDIYETETQDSWIIKHVRGNGTTDFIEIYSIEELDRRLAYMLVNMVIEEIQCHDYDAVTSQEEISLMAEYLIIEEE